MSLLAQPIFEALRPFVRIETYARDGGHRHPRIRIEIDPLPPLFHAAAVQATMPCVDCGRLIRFVRERRGKRGKPGGLYYAPTCPLRVSLQCRSSGAARDEYEAVRAAFARRPPPGGGRQLLLLGGDGFDEDAATEIDAQYPDSEVGL